jgi:hypothetical protein
VRTAGEDVIQPTITPSQPVDSTSTVDEPLSHVRDTSGETCSEKEEGEEQPKQCSSTSSTQAEEDKEFKDTEIPKTSLIEVFKMKMKSEDVIDKCLELVKPHLKPNITFQEIKSIISEIRKMKSKFETK